MLLCLMEMTTLQLEVFFLLYFLYVFRGEIATQISL